MKVVKDGRPQKGWAKEYKCTGQGNKDGGCGAILLVEEPDLFHTYRSCMGRDEDWFITFKCQCCGCFTDIDAPFRANDLPSHKEWVENEKHEFRIIYNDGGQGHCNTECARSNRCVLHKEGQREPDKYFPKFKGEVDTYGVIVLTCQEKRGLQ